VGGEKVENTDTHQVIQCFILTHNHEAYARKVLGRIPLNVKGYHKAFINIGFNRSISRAERDPVVRIHSRLGKPQRSLNHKHAPEMMEVMIGQDKSTQTNAQP
jgi:hypothetical protein